jgi:hypothetical protein
VRGQRIATLKYLRVSHGALLTICNNLVHIFIRYCFTGMDYTAATQPFDRSFQQTKLFVVVLLACCEELAT